MHKKKKSRKIYISEGTFSKLISKKHMILIDPFYLVGTSCVCVWDESHRGQKFLPHVYPLLSLFPPIFDALTDCHCLQSKEKGWWNFYEDCKMLPGTLSAWGHIPLASTFNQFHKWIHQPNYLCCKKNHYSRVLSVQQFVIVYSLLSEKIVMTGMIREI